MKVNIENQIKVTNNIGSTGAEFVDIVNVISSSKTKNELESKMNSMHLTNFIFGFGGYHMWLKQTDGTGNIISDRLLMVDYT